MGRSEGRFERTDFVLLERGRWWSTPPGSTDPQLRSAPEVRPPEGPSTTTVEPADPSAFVVVAGPRLLLFADGRLSTWDAAIDDLVDLTPDEVAILGNEAPRQVASLAEEVGSAASAAAHLAALGLVELLPEAPPPEPEPAPDPVPVVEPAPRPERTDGRVRVLASWDIQLWGQPLALGGLLAYARVYDGGRLASLYDLRPVLNHEQLLAELEADPSPAVILLSDYIWSADRNREIAREARATSPDHLILHGGPHVPKFVGDKKAFFTDNPAIDAIAHGEGEITFVEVLDALGGALGDTTPLETVPGLTVRTSSGFSETPERPRHEHLEDFPSAYLTGEFDHLDPSGWQWPSVETNRGCPYSCTFCDWGSATRSRIRDFPTERVLAELDWLAERHLPHWMINDANFGIHRRDVDIAAHVVELRRAHGVPDALYVNYAKNTVKYLAQIIGMLTEAGITGEGALALQTRDEETLRAIRRSNIRTDKYDELADEFRRYGLPLVTDIIIGMPGQTVRSLLADMQYCFDNDVTPRFFVALNLPNAEFNDPAYRARFQMVLGDGDVVVQTSSFTFEDRTRMMRLRMAFRAFEHFGILRQVLHLLQWDHGIIASDALERIERRVHDEPERYPFLSWILGYLDIFLLPPVAWRLLYEEVGRLLEDEFALAPSSEVATVLRVQEVLMPAPGRTFPASVEVPHDYATWYETAKAAGGAPVAPLTSYGPATFTVAGDPIFRCTQVMGRMVDERPHELITTAFWAAHNWELDSPVQRLVPETAVSEATKRREARREQSLTT